MAAADEAGAAGPRGLNVRSFANTLDISRELSQTLSLGGLIQVWARAVIVTRRLRPRALTGLCCLLEAQIRQQYPRRTQHNRAVTCTKPPGCAAKGAGAAGAAGRAAGGTAGDTIGLNKNSCSKSRK